MAERTLEPTESVETEEETSDDVETEEETETKSTEEKNEDDGVESLFESDVLNERQKKEIETLKKKAADFDGLTKKREQKKPKVVPPVFNEDIIRNVLYKENEKKVLKAVVDEDSPLYIPELVSDKNFQEVIGFLPRSFDKSSQESIHHGLRVAVRLWEEFKGKKKTEKKPDTSAELSASAGVSGSGTARQGETRSERKFIKKSSSDIKDWYKNEE